MELKTNEFYISDLSSAKGWLLFAIFGISAVVVAGIMLGGLNAMIRWLLMFGAIFFIIMLVRNKTRCVLRVDSNSLTVLSQDGVVISEIPKETIGWVEMRETNYRNRQSFSLRIEASGQKFYYSIVSKRVGELAVAFKENGYMLKNEPVGQALMREGASVKNEFVVSASSKTRIFLGKLAKLAIFLVFILLFAIIFTGLPIKTYIPVALINFLTENYKSVMIVIVVSTLILRVLSIFPSIVIMNVSPEALTFSGRKTGRIVKNEITSVRVVPVKNGYRVGYMISTDHNGTNSVFTLSTVADVALLQDSLVKKGFPLSTVS